MKKSLKVFLIILLAILVFAVCLITYVTIITAGLKIDDIKLVDMDKTITFSIREEDRDRERRMLLRAVYDALCEKGYNPIDQMVGYILTEEPAYITNHKNARGMIRKIDTHELLAAMLKEYMGL